MTDRVETALRDLQFEVPARLVEQAKRAAAKQALETVASSHELSTPARTRELRRDRTFALLAALLAIAIVVTLVFVGQRLQRQSLVPGGLGPVPSGRPVAIGPPASFDCPNSKKFCVRSDPVFTSPNIAWMAVSSTATGTTDLYRSDDAGIHWRALISWTNPALSTISLPDPYVVQIKSSGDGKEALVVTGWGVDRGASLLYTSDGGLSWTAQGFPAEAGPYEPPCLNVACNPGEAFFLNPREGWVASAAGSAETRLYHTIDSGHHWTLSGRFPTVGHINPLQANFVFADSQHGWLVPPPTENPPISQTIFSSHDGGATWQPRTLATPRTLPAYSGVARAYSNAALVSVTFFDAQHGLVVMEGMNSVHCTDSGGGQTCWADGKQPFANDGYWTYAYTTTDGGKTWSPPIAVVTSELVAAGTVDFIDTDHWIAFSTSSTNPGVIRTDDAGGTWTAVSASISGLPPGSQALLDSLHFTDALHGWATIRCSGLLAVTSDGGAHWSVRTPPGLALPTQPIQSGCFS